MSEHLNFQRFFNAINITLMSFNKSIFSFLLFGLLLQSCGSDAPDVNAKSKAEVATQLASRELADAKVDAMIDTATPSELLETEESKAEAAREAKAEQAKAKKEAVDKAREEKDKARKEKRAKRRAERDKKAQEERRRKRREKRAAKKLAAEQTAKTTSSAVQTAEPIPVEYQNNTSRSTTSSRNGAPVVSFYKTIHKYGTIEQGDKVEYKFRFVNAGKSELVVTDATASCGCTKPSYPFIPIEPGGEGYIGVVFDSKGKLGRQKPSVVITTNADPASYTIYLEGYVDSAEKAEEANNDENDKKEEDGKSF